MVYTLSFLYHMVYQIICIMLNALYNIDIIYMVNLYYVIWCINYLYYLAWFINLSVLCYMVNLVNNYTICQIAGMSL